MWGRRQKTVRGWVGDVPVPERVCVLEPDCDLIDTVNILRERIAQKDRRISARETAVREAGEELTRRGQEIAALKEERDSLLDLASESDIEVGTLIRRVEELEAEVARLTPAEMSIESAKEMLSSAACEHCGGHHSTAPACLRVRRIIRHVGAGTIEVVYWRDGEWSKDGIAWPDDLAAIIHRAAVAEG